MKRLFHIATDEEIKRGETTDVYFVRTKDILKAKGYDKVKVVAEVTVSSLPEGWPWAVLVGLDEALKLLEGLPIDVYAVPEGTIVRAKDYRGVKIPLVIIEGPYYEFCIYETPLLGFLCQASGVATRAARIRKIVGKDKILLAFGIRRMHPAIAPMLDRAAYIGGFDGVSSLIGAKTIGKKPMGTMPHALVLVMGDQVKAWKAFDEVMPPEVPRIMLVDTFYDEKIEAIMAAEALGDRIYGVRLDTPSSRKGKFADIIREVRWELDIRGYKNVKIIVSGGVNEHNVKELAEAGADGFGIGTFISNAPVVDLAMDIVEVEGKPISKRGKFSGRKSVWRCPNDLEYLVTPRGHEAPKCPRCGSTMENILVKYIENGKIIRKLPSVDEIREYVLRQLDKIREL
ncbi:MAG: nicotinate phosphoribosyltransferase [Thermoprotei archaeon]|nr:MAG: nicotinate phosphoribosyltransferase [Thermoprotei archaeon]RLF19524.1 MAG: nicotinate phosphoribosyltransferase [Thermoprotei archaeon]